MNCANGFLAHVRRIILVVQLESNMVTNGNRIGISDITYPKITLQPAMNHAGSCFNRMPASGGLYNNAFLQWMFRKLYFCHCENTEEICIFNHPYYESNWFIKQRGIE